MTALEMSKQKSGTKHQRQEQRDPESSSGCRQSMEGNEKINWKREDREQWKKLSYSTLG
jgi:hypothetical protein